MAKLVCDRIPDLFGGSARPLNTPDFREALRGKLREDTAE